MAQLRQPLVIVLLVIAGVSGRRLSVPSFMTSTFGDQAPLGHVQPRQPITPWDFRSWKRSLLPSDSTCGLSGRFFRKRIVGGEEARLGEFPWLALIGYKYNIVPDYYSYYYDEVRIDEEPLGETEIKFDCGGSLINPRYVVTAAHCVHGQEHEIETIRLGEHNVNEDEDCEVTSDYNGIRECNDPPLDITPEKIIRHKEYDRRNNKNDIALIRLSQSVIFNRWISPICLPFGNWPTKKLSSEEATLAGFGFTAAFGERSTTLQKVALPMVSVSDCNSKYASLRATINDTLQLCAGGVIGRDTCRADSGGPLMMHGDSGSQLYLIGITSFGTDFCGVDGTPGVYVRVTHYVDWILDKIHE